MTDLKPIFDKSRTTFEKIITILVLTYIVTVMAGSNLNLDVYVYAGFGTYVILGLIAFFKPNIMMEVLRKENEEYLVRNQRKIPLLKAGFRIGGFILTITGAVLNYVFVVYY